ncbi:MAG: hypothetical protein QNK15_02840 [Cycloclasticus sp.]|nr:hypothetical protein [Cycloclasticus sp.]
MSSKKLERDDITNNSVMVKKQSSFGLNIGGASKSFLNSFKRLITTFSIDDKLSPATNKSGHSTFTILAHSVIVGVGNLIQQSRVFLAKNLRNRMVCCMPKDVDVNEIVNCTLSDNDSAFALRRG